LAIGRYGKGEQGEDFFYIFLNLDTSSIFSSPNAQNVADFKAMCAAAVASSNFPNFVAKFCLLRFDDCSLIKPYCSSATLHQIFTLFFQETAYCGFKVTIVPTVSVLPYR
jgi:hypothetical protein